MRNDCSLSGGWCLKGLTRGEYINSKSVDPAPLQKCNVWRGCNADQRTWDEAEKLQGFCSSTDFFMQLRVLCR